MEDIKVQTSRVIDVNDSQVIEKQALDDRLGDAHLNILPTKKIIVCLAALSLGLFASFADQTSITIALPAIAKDLRAETTINWAGTAALLANCVCQVLFGRLADIFGRKNILLFSLGTQAVADIGCAVSRTGVEFYIFRAIAGIGCGGTQSLTMVMLSDICTLKQRGKYQGILGAQVGLANALGPFIMAAFVEHTTWRDFYYMMIPLVISVMVTIYFLIDGKKNASQLNNVLSRKEKFKKIDYLGMFFSTASLTLLLIPISGGGSSYPWNSPLIIGMFVSGGLSFFVFIYIEWKLAELPMIPLRIFASPSLSLILGSNFLYGMAYYGFTYYLPYYLQIVRGLDSIHASIILLPLVLTQSIASIIGGTLISYFGHYKNIILMGYGLWTVSCGLLYIFNTQTNWGVIVVILLVMGVGVGWTFQPTMVAAQSQAKKSDRAIVISARNVLRSFGGSVGISIASMIVSNSLLREIRRESKNEGSILDGYLDYLKDHIYSRVDTSKLNHAQQVVVREMYMKAIKNYFYICLPLIAVCFISTIFVVDRGLQCIDEEPEQKNKDKESDIDTSSNSSRQ
ncbi:suppressor of gal11 null [Scheffersomyces stipitis CBS 6054]|uniref:Suppressor of gal11 null n=1 Tax=Scheffersomyces stipitis (strain ATCC 58785 / CBS 6054 / NBRC 10063 / NRRL Y-11545) TaxID=322104 RepID=A3GH09_PICST|nr:suppressor of gal11 null [Scheffersomyces stipitis CBS 6054]EAZ64011.1 suppressor of gal11 null [Scheffersomyces stipitis CBS 6054]